jgi:hypothetical protein
MLEQIEIALIRTSRGLLLGYAVERAKTPDEVSGIDGDDLACGEEVGKDVQGNAVFGIIEDRYQNGSVCDVEIAVGGRKATAFEDHWCGHGKLDDLEGFTVLIGGRFQAA